MDQSLSEIWGESEALIEVKSRLSRAARVNRPVLILGERGTGKELAAARLHYLSPRWKGIYLTLNCAALNPNLLESELFGYEPGAFTGAARVSPGRFEAADGGTLFLDEISHLSLPAQAKILRVVEYGSFQRLGSNREQKVDVRLVSASNVDLKARAAAGDFLPDLLDRLSFEVIKLPPLRERSGDVSLLTHLFAARMAAELGLKEVPAFSPEALEKLEAYDWPGNIRELKNTVERAVYREPASGIGPEDLELDLSGSPAVAPAPETPSGGGDFDRLLAAYARSLLDRALARSRYNQREAAAALGLTYHRFRFLRRKYYEFDGDRQSGPHAPALAGRGKDSLERA
ncbi:MAG: sigma 54-interacting transcriptional regulator [Candidatus Adiutrix sp.]|nr:sigma 54-interacting transcriptional regulator [Candidatus Adiutrix sp.]